MATQLLASGAGMRVSGDQTVGAGEVHTLIPFEQGGNWKVQVDVKDSANGYTTVGMLPDDTEKVRQLAGPLTYRASVRNCGLSVETGA